MDHTFHGHTDEEFDANSASEPLAPVADNVIRKIWIAILVASVLIISFLAIFIWLSQPTQSALFLSNFTEYYSLLTPLVLLNDWNSRIRYHTKPPL
jgi:hypothetical protein